VTETKNDEDVADEDVTFGTVCVLDVDFIFGIANDLRIVFVVFNEEEKEDEEDEEEEVVDAFEFFFLFLEAVCLLLFVCVFCCGGVFVFVFFFFCVIFSVFLITTFPNVELFVLN
jgi:hypothetical protein